VVRRGIGEGVVGSDEVADGWVFACSERWLASVSAGL
jgi:hypothetical protein